jgi:hypothetical protein
LGRAIHAVRFFESMVVFDVDRRVCGPSQVVEAGTDALPQPDIAPTIRSRIGDALQLQPRWVQSLFQPARAAVRTSKRMADANRVRRYFR